MKVNPVYFEQTRREILSRGGACFGVSCKNCPLAGEWTEGFGFRCAAGGQGNYSKIETLLLNPSPDAREEGV